MNEHDRTAEALRWLRYARDDLEIADEMMSNAARARYSCWLSQQSAEKALKALLVLEGIHFPFIHDLEALIPLYDAWPTGIAQIDLEHLTDLGGESRYPGDYSEPTAEHASQSESEARAVYELIEAEFARRGVNVEQA